MTYTPTHCICGDPHPHVHHGSNYGPGRVEHLDDWPWFVKQGKPAPTWTPYASSTQMSGER